MENKYIVNGEELTEEEFRQLNLDPNIKLKLVEGTGNQYIKLLKLQE